MKDAFICEGIRTPIGKFGGQLSSIRTDDLAAIPLKYFKNKLRNFDWENVDEVLFGNANQAGEDNRNLARMAILLSGLPQKIPGITLNRLCASGMEAIIAGSRMIKADEGNLIIAGGAESMSRAPFVMPKSNSAFSRNAEIYDTTIGWRFINPVMKELYGIDSMPQTAENVAEKFQITRDDQDQFAYQSQIKASKSISCGRIGKEIIEVSIKQRKKNDLIFVEDEHPRNTSLDKLAQLPTPFKENGTITAGNSSGVNDGSAALIIANQEAIKKNGLNPIARIVKAASAGVEPRIMGIGPISSTKKVLRESNLEINQMDIIEINEAFAAQVLACTRELGINDDDERINPNGGAIAYGHPLGMSGTRLVLTAAKELELKNYKYALCTMCVGVGQGSSIILEKV